MADGVAISSFLGAPGRGLLPGFDETAGTLPGMGLNPFREQRKTAFDVAMVVGAVVVTIGIVLWAMFGG